MGIVDYILMICVISGAGYLLYKSGFSGKKGCSCSLGTCKTTKEHLKK